jgi:SNF family Na+-dependent transporter
MKVEVFAALVMIAVVIEKLIAALVQPLFIKLKIDTWWLLYVSFVVGGLFGWATGLNAFPVFTSAGIGQLLTALICGAGPTFLYDLIDNGQQARLPKATPLP